MPKKESLLRYYIQYTWVNLKTLFYLLEYQPKHLFSEGILGVIILYNKGKLNFDYFLKNGK